MDSNRIHHPSPANKMKCSFFHHVQVLMISWAGWWTRTPSATFLQQKKWNAHFWITFNFWWSAGLVGGLKPHSPPFFSQKNEMLIFWLCSTSDDQLGWSMDSNLIHHPSPAKTVKCSFLYYIQHLMLARLVNGLESHPPSLSSQKMKCSFLGYVHLLMITQAVRWTQTPSSTPLQPIKWNATFWIMFTFDDQPGWLMDSKSICQPSPANKMKYSFLDYVQLLMISRACQWTWTPSTTCLQAKKLNAHILIMFNFWCWPDWSMDSNPIHQISSANKMKCFFYGLCSLLMINQVGWWTQTPSATLLQTKKWNAHFLIMFNFWWSADLVNGLKPHLPALSSQ